MSAENTNPLGWLPRPGEYKPVPGGVIWCDSTEVDHSHDGVSGKIVFRFRLTEEAYAEAMEAPKQLAPPKKELTPPADKQREER